MYLLYAVMIFFMMKMINNDDYNNFHMQKYYLNGDKCYVFAGIIMKRDIIEFFNSRNEKEVAHRAADLSVRRIANRVGGEVVEEEKE